MKTFEYTWSFKTVWQADTPKKSTVEALNLANAKILLYQEYGAYSCDVLVDYDSVKEVSK